MWPMSSPTCRSRSTSGGHIRPSSRELSTPEKTSNSASNRLELFAKQRLYVLAIGRPPPTRRRRQMKVRDLIEILEDQDPDAEVLVMSQENWPFENAIAGVAV